MSRPSIGSAARDQVITFRCTKAEKERIEHAADEAGITPGRFAYLATIKRALVLDLAEAVDVPVEMIEPDTITAHGGWCAPSEVYALGEMKNVPLPPGGITYEED